MPGCVPMWFYACMLIISVYGLHHCEFNPALCSNYLSNWCHSGPTPREPSSADAPTEDAPELLDLSGLPFRYVMTDFTERNIEFWRIHPSLKPLVDLGVLDFAVFNAETDTQLSLVVSGDVLSSETLQNPLIVISNYIFDTLTAVSLYFT